MNKIRSIYLLLLLLSSAGFVFTAGLPSASITVHVSDSQTLAPIAEAKTRITFTVPNGQGGTKPLQRASMTDANGEFSATENSLFYISADAQKPGYYRTTASLDLRPTLNETYGPPAVIAIMLKRIGHPAAMYARKHARLELPKVGEQLGFDLIAFDWVAPYGRGQVGDFLFDLQDPSKGGNDTARTLLLSFSNDGDGIQSFEADPNEGSELRLPAIAPESGYAPSLIQRADKSYRPNKKANYFFRIRTKKEGSTIRTALYGKIHGDIGVDTINSNTALVFLTYYLNPDATRNVEFDPNKNLFKELPGIEQVRDP
jgi:hypothetical protein